MELEEAKQMLKSYAGMSHKLTDNQGRPKLDQAIDLMLKELDKYKEAYDLETIERAKFVNYSIELNEELEKYKKIAEFMAKQIDNYDTQLVINRFRSKEDVLDWARNEVENETKK